MAKGKFENFEGWFALDKDTGVGGMKWQAFEPKQLEENDVDIKITHCGSCITLAYQNRLREVADALYEPLGICGSDVHALRSNWFPTDYPCCAGHEYCLSQPRSLATTD